MAAVEAGPSQCQWSPWGWHPTDSVGLGARGSSLVVLAAPVAGPSQCLYAVSFAGLIVSVRVIPVVAMWLAANRGCR
jgi:hypothetical protein